MKTAAATLVLPCLLLLASCAGTGSLNAWTNPALDDAQSQQALDTCQAQAMTAEQDYIADKSRGGANTTTAVINNMKVRQTAMALGNDTLASCMQLAGFSRK